MDNITNKWKTIVNKNSTAIAIIDQDKQYTYSEINQKIIEYVHVLKEKEILSHSAIGVYMTSSADYWASIMAILFCNCYFVPIDIDLPKGRINQIIETANIHYIVVDKNLKENIFNNCVEININDLSDSILNYSYTEETDYCKIAYVLFTSGTSGAPKGVIISRDALNNLFSWFGKKYNIDNNTRLLQLANLSFDVSIEEFFGILMNGGIVVISDDRCRFHTKWFSEYIQKYTITMVQMIPRMAKVLLCETTSFPSLKTVILGAEQLTDEIKNKIIRKGYKLFNHYGPTECTVDTLTTECNLNDTVSIGRPITNMECYIVDEYNNIISEYLQIGELIISGVGVAEGYINNIEETKKHFVFENDGLKKSYRTGDLVMKNLQGDYVFIGRKDNQIKINGKRIEIEEILNVTLSIDGITECIVYVIEENDSKILSLFWIGSATKDDIIKYLTLKLPSYMIPNILINIDKFPINNNSKIDYEKLKEIYRSYTKGQQKELNSVMKNILKIISNAMDRDIKKMNALLDSGIEELGIDSMLFVQIIVAIEVEYNIELDDDFLLVNNFSTLFEFIQCIHDFLIDKRYLYEKTSY